jgi:hypothetical protein
MIKIIIIIIINVKGKFHPTTGHEGPEGGKEVLLYSSSTLGARC